MEFLPKHELATLPDIWVNQNIAKWPPKKIFNKARAQRREPDPLWPSFMCKVVYQSGKLYFYFVIMTYFKIAIKLLLHNSCVPSIDFRRLPANLKNFSVDSEQIFQLRDIFFQFRITSGQFWGFLWSILKHFRLIFYII